MNEQEKITYLEKEIEKLKFHVSILNNHSFYEENPLDSLVISFNWSEEDLDKVHDIFEKYDYQLEENGQINGLYHDIEHDFREQLGLGYQSVKSVILAFFRNNQWVDVCVAFVKSQGERLPVEFREISAYIRDNNL